MSKTVLKNLLLLSAFCILLEVARMIKTESINYIFLPFNLLLAGIPVLFAQLAYKEQATIRLYFYLLMWLLFFPNSPYIITDLIHLKLRAGSPLWFDAILIYSYAFTGMLVGLYSALLVYKKLTTVIPRYKAKIVLLFCMLLAGYGIYIGRFLRWNSWDLITHPVQLVTDTYTRILYPLSYPRTYGVTLIIGLLLCLAFSTLNSFTEKEEI